MTRLDRAIGERNRELLAQRLRWPPGALDQCRAFERDYPGWYARTSNATTPAKNAT